MGLCKSSHASASAAGEILTNEETNLAFYKSLKYVLWIGYVIGVYPIQKSISTKSSIPLEIKKASLAYLYSFLLLVFKSTSTFQLWLLLCLYKQMSAKQVSPTDEVAGDLGFLFTYCFGIFAHIMSIWKLSSFLQCMKSIESYDQKYPMLNMKKSNEWTESHKFGFRLMLGRMIPTLVIISTPIYILYKTSSRDDVMFDIYILPGIYTRTKSVVCIFLSVAFIFMELGVAFLYLQIFGLVGHMKVRISQFIQLMEEKTNTTKNKSMLLDFGFIFKKQQQHQTNKNWKALGQQYIELLDVFGKFKDFVGPYYLILFPSLLVSLICLGYSSTTNGSQPPTVSHTLSWLLTILATRIFTLAQSGENFQRKYKKLVKAVMTASLTQEFQDEDEQDQLDGLVKLVTTAKLQLTAGGFFIVSRRNVTSIVSVIITYWIVLFQFRISG